MRKPRLGFSRDIYEILEEHGPLAYHGIRQHLNARGSEMKPKQTRCAISNLCQRGYVERSRKDHRRFEVIKTRNIGLEMADPIQTPSLVEKTPESVEITPTEGLFGMNLKDSAIVILIAVITSALTTTILEKI